MRVTIIAALAAVPLFGSVPGAMACGWFGEACTPSAIVWPRYTANGERLGTVEATVQRLPSLEVSRFTGQPVTVIYDHPGSRPGAIEPYLHLVPLPRAKRSDTIGAYPVGY